MKWSNSESRLFRSGLVGLILALSGSVVAGETDYRVAYDYPGLAEASPGPLGSLSEPWRDFGALSLVPAQQGVDYPQSYLAELVGFEQGPPVARTLNAHTQYEFLYGLVLSCAQSATNPCSADLFKDRFEALD